MILGPICQVGWASACAGVTARRSRRPAPERAARGGEHERSSCSGATPCRHWAIAECSLSTGRMLTAARCAASVTRSPPATRLSLLASARSEPAASAARVASSPAAPTIAFSTTSARSRPARPRRAARPAPRPRSRRGHPGGVGVGERDPADTVLVRRRTSSAWDCADSAHDGQLGVVAHHLERLHAHRASRAEDRDGPHGLSVAGGFAASVSPRSRPRPSGAAPGPRSTRPRRRTAGVDPVEHPAVAAQQVAGVLHAHVALEIRLEQVADRRGDRDRGGHPQRMERADGVVLGLVVEHSQATASPITRPMISPSTVLFGEISAASLRRPISRPPT